MWATIADAHREWHLNAGVPMGQPGCPQDACHLPDPSCWDCLDETPDTCPACIAAAAESAAWLAERAANPPADPWGFPTVGSEVPF